MKVLALLLSLGAWAGVPEPAEEAQARVHLTEALSRLHRLNQLEIKWGEVGRAAPPGPVRQLASRLIREHRRNDERLLKFARRRNITLGNAVPMAQLPPDLKWRAELHRLEIYQGGDFANRYLSGLTGLHEEAIEYVGACRALSRDPELNELLDGTAAQLLAQLAEVRSLPHR